MINEKSAKIGNRQLEEIKDVLDILTSNKSKFKADVVLKKFFKQRRYLGSKDRKIISDICYAYYRWYPFVKKMDLYDSVFILQIFENIKHPPFVDFYLNQESYSEKVVSLDKFLSLDIDEKISLLNKSFKFKLNKYKLFPIWMLNEIPKELQNDVIDGTQKRANIIIRSSHLYKNEDFPFSVSKHESLMNAYVVPSQSRLIDSEMYKNGLFDIQDTGSQMICLVANPGQKESWWDCCAGGGGKSLYLANLMKNTGSILASDIRLHSLNETERRAKIQKISTIEIKKHDLIYRLENRIFDGVLIDAPCSGSGTWRRHPADRWTFKKSELKQLNHLQYKMLMNVKDNVKRSGLLIYATCSVFKSENEDIINRFLAENKEFKLEAFNNPFNSETCNGMLRSIPSKNDSDGMFVARLRKL